MNPKYLTKNGIKEFVVLAYDEFEEMNNKLQDYEDLLDLRKAKKKEYHKKTITLEKVKKKLSLESGMIKNLSIDDYIESVSDEEQEHYSKLVQNLSEDDKEISSKAIYQI